MLICNATFSRSVARICSNFQASKLEYNKHFHFTARIKGGKKNDEKTVSPILICHSCS